MPVDVTLLINIGVAGATFVAIVAAFFTTKIISLAGDKQRIKNQIASIDSELQGRYESRDAILRLIDSIEGPRAKARIEGYLEEMLEKDFKEVPSIAELQAIIEDEKSTKLDPSEIKALKEAYPTFKKKLQGKIDEAKGKILLPLDALFPSLADRLKIIREGFVLPRYAFNTELLMPTEVGRLTELYNELFREDIQIGILERNKNMYEQQLASITFPRLIKLGFASQLYFVIVGVVIPFSYGSWAFSIPDFANIVGLGLFFSGLSVIFTYIGIETFLATQRKHHNESTKQGGKAFRVISTLSYNSEF